MLVSTETGGLGNRIKSWVSARRLDPEARVYWPRNDNMPASFGELFANDSSIDSIPSDAVEHCSWQLAVPREDFDELPAGFARVVSSSSPLRRRLGRLWWTCCGRPGERYRYMVRPKRFSRRMAGEEGRVIDLEYGRIPEYFLRVYRPLFAEVVARPAIQERVAAFAAANIDPEVIGVQIRTWRDAPRRQRKHHRPAVGRLKRLLGAAGADRRFLVVSDDDDVVPWVQDIVGSARVIAFPRDTERRQSWQSAEGMAEDLIDMLLLARTSELYASYLSTFSEVAWWLGGAKARVSVF